MKKRTKLVSWESKFMQYYKNIICDALRDLVPFVQFKKRKKHPWRSVTFSKVPGFINKTMSLLIEYLVSKNIWPCQLKILFQLDCNETLVKDFTPGRSSIQGVKEIS